MAPISSIEGKSTPSEVEVAVERTSSAEGIDARLPALGVIEVEAAVERMAAPISVTLGSPPSCTLS